MMKLIVSIVTGGFLKGKRTYILGFALAIQAVVGYMVGDTTLAEFGDRVPEIIGGMGLVTLRAAAEKPAAQVTAVIRALVAAGVIKVEKPAELDKL